MKRRLERLNLFVGIAKMDKIGKSDADFAKLLGVIRAELAAAQDIRRAA
jgi:hypothetical protein